MNIAFRYGRSLVILSIVLPILLLICAGIGAYYIEPWKIPSILWAKEAGYEILLQLRFPRVVLAVLVGASLAVSGVGLQGLFRNPLAAPDLIGVSSGAALGAAFWIVVLSGHVSFAYGLPISAFVGSVAVVLLIFKISKMNGTLGMASLLLCGIAINAIAGSGLGLLTYFSKRDEELRSLTFWLMGGLGGATWEMILFALPFYAIGFSVIFTLGKSLNALALGESEAFCIGVSVEKCKIKTVFAVALLVGTSVSLSGGIGFIGLVTPHLLRLWVGSDHRWLLFSSTLAGAALLLLADLASRTIALPAEIPIGIITSLMGGPFFLWLLIRQRKALLNGI